MTSVDKRVVEMEFDNKQFEAGVKTTIGSLDALNKGLKLEGATKGLNDISNASSRFSLAGIASGVENISSKFSNLGVIAISTLANIATRAVSAGVQLAKSLSLDPVLQGLSIYETKLNSIQTILANTSGDKTTLKNVTDALQQLNTYSNQTIYNFGEMARNIGTFTAAGVKLDTAVSAIKGIANLAAISGASADQASGAMYQLSQALATGTLKLQDWNSVVNAGLGGKVFQDALMETARVHGIAIDTMVKDEGGFRNTLQKGWLTSTILTETLNKFTGDLTAKQLKAQGYTDAQIVSIIKLGQLATEAATKVKTLPQLLDVLKESVATGWATTFEIVFGTIDEAKTLFTNVNNVIGGFITASAAARNKVLSDWKELGGRTVLITAISNAFHALIAVLKPIKDAFRSIFPATTGKDLFNLTVTLEKFTEKLKIGADTANNLKRTFAGFFAVLDIGWQIIKQVGRFLGDLIGMLSTGQGGFLKTTGSVGDFLVALDKAIKSGKGLREFFVGLEHDLAGPIKLINLLRGYLGSLFDGFDPDKAAKSVTNFAGKLAGLTDFSKGIRTVWTNVISILGKVWDTFQPLTQRFESFFRKLGGLITSSLSGINYQDVLSTLNTGLLAGFVLLIKQVVDKFKKGNAQAGLLDGIKGAIDQLTNTFKTMQNTLRAATLLEIAAAIGIMTISVIALSKVDSAGLTRALTAIGVMFVQLAVALSILENSIAGKSLLKLYFVTGALSLLAIAIDLLTIAVTKLSKLDWNQLAKGLTGVTALLAALIVTMRLMPATTGMISTGLGILAISAAINILVKAVTGLSGLSWEQMAKGLTGVGVLLVALALFTKFAAADATGILSGVGIILLAVGINILADAVKKFGKLDWGSIAKGLTAMAGSLAIIAVALDAISPTAPLSAAGVLIVALSLGKIAEALQQLATMSWGGIGKSLTALLGAMTIITLALDLIFPTAPLSAAGVLIVAIALGKVAVVLDQFAQMGWGDIGKAMVVLAGSLGIIALAMIAMTEALPGAAALLVVSASLNILQPILAKFGDMSWKEILKSLVELGGIFVVLGVSGLLLAPIVPILLGLGVAIDLIGLGIGLAGAGVFLFAAGLTALAAAGAVGTAALVAMVAALAGLIPLVMTQLGLGIVAFAKVIATGGPAFTAAITVVLMALLDAIIKLTPKIVATLEVLLEKLLDLLVKEIPKMVSAGLKILLGFLSGISDNIGKVVTVATSIIVNFLNGISNNLPRVIDSGIKLIISFVNGLADGIRNNTAAMRAAGGNLASAIIDGMTGGLFGGVGRIIDAARNVASQALQAAKNFLGIGSPSKEFHLLGKFSALGLANGLDAFAHVVARASADVGETALSTLKNSLTGLSTVIPDHVDLNPVITPVLDLTALKDDANKIGDILKPPPITVNTSLDSAQNASTGFDNFRKPGPGDDPGAAAGVTNNFTQNNYSPKALSSAEIYRQTRNQISTVKGALP